MISLSVNINKVATLRNSRGIDVPNLRDTIEICLNAGCHGITVHPRSDQRHIRFDDLPVVKSAIDGRAELNVECDPAEEFIELVLTTRPTQCTLVPTVPGEITSSVVFDLTRHADELRPKIERLKQDGIRVSLFSGTDPEQVQLAKRLDVDAIELYTGPYAMASVGHARDAEYAKLLKAAEAADRLGLRVHCGHDLTVDNLAPIARLPGLKEVSIGHHLIARALMLGLPTVIREHLGILS